jgi:protein gp37
MGQKNYLNGFEPAIHPHALELPLSWKKPQTIFVNSMSDLFLDEVPTEVIMKVFDVMRRATWHTFQVLTKRSDRLARISRKLPWAQNIWMGVSIENADYAFRADHLRMTGASVKFLSMEPLLGPAPDLNLDDIDWVIVGGESGPGARQMEEEWVVGIKEMCLQANVPFFFKQWGGVQKKKAGRELQGRVWEQMPRIPDQLDFATLQA